MCLIPQALGDAAAGDSKAKVEEGADTKEKERHEQKERERETAKENEKEKEKPKRKYHTDEGLLVACRYFDRTGTVAICKDSEYQWFPHNHWQALVRGAHGTRCSIVVLISAGCIVRHNMMWPGLAGANYIRVDDLRRLMHVLGRGLPHWLVREAAGVLATAVRLQA